MSATPVSLVCETCENKQANNYFFTERDGVVAAQCVFCLLFDDAARDQVKGGLAVLGCGPLEGEGAGAVAVAAKVGAKGEGGLNPLLKCETCGVAELPLVSVKHTTHHHFVCLKCAFEQRHARDQLAKSFMWIMAFDGSEKWVRYLKAASDSFGIKEYFRYPTRSMKPLVEILRVRSAKRAANKSA